MTQEFKNDLWETPPEIFYSINITFNNKITLDVACNYSNYKTMDRMPIERYDSLKLPWRTDGLYWCNPPYSQKEQWLRKAHKELKLGNEGLLLLPASLETTWFKTYVTVPNVPFLVWEKRISFIDPGTKKPVNGNRTGSVLLAFVKDKTELPRHILGQPWRVNL